MIASERSLASAHQTQSPKTTALGNARNGASKPPVRPVKIYVIDPRKLQQRLEAFVDQKNQKRAEAEAERQRQDKQKNEKSKEEECTSSSSTTKTPANKSAPGTTANNAAVKQALPAKILPALAPKIQPSAIPLPQQSAHLNLTQHECGVLGNGMTLQSLPCINAAGLGLPALPLVVTNGVALIQPPTSQSSIPTSGLFLPGVTAISSVVSNDGTLLGPSQQIKAKQRFSTTKKRKVRKKKAAKKRKVVDDAKEKDEEDDGELSYLLKETTTRLGRISRPVSQPHSPSFLAAAPMSAASSRAPSPNSKLKKKVAPKEQASFRCRTCVQIFVSKEKLNSHFDEFPLHNQQSTVIPKSLQKKLTTSTNSFNNVQGSVTLSHPPSPNFSRMESAETAVLITEQSTTETPSNTSQINLNYTEDDKLEGNLEIPDKDAKRIRNSSSSNFDIFPKTTHASSFDTSLAATTTTSSTSPRNSIFATVTHTTSNSSSGQRNTTTNDHYVESIDKDTRVNVSLVPIAGDDNDLFRRCMSSPSNVVHVPSSYSIPSSPPSRCQSPRSPRSPHAACNSPVDPMLLQSRSPFPPPIPETSSHSVGASNLSIPEESLCKGELFMDLGDGVLENTSLSTISPTPFDNNDSTIGLLFADSAMKESEHQLQHQEIIHSNTDDVEQRDSSSVSSPVVTPMLIETTTEDANDGEIFQTANYTRTFLHPSVISSTNTISSVDTLNVTCEERSISSGRAFANCAELPRTPQSACLESDVSMDSSEIPETNVANNQRCRSIWQFVKDQIKSRGISQACGEISEMADKLSRIARDHFIPIREEEIERLGNSSSIIHVDTPFFSHLLDLPFGMYIFKEDVGSRKKIPPPPPMTSSELSFTGGVEDVEKFLPPDIDLISLPHLTNLDLT